jgi:putative ABC transport system permease protein
MTALTVKGMVAHWQRALLTGMAAVVGVAIVAGTLIVSDTADRLGSQDSDLGVVRRVMFIAGGVTLLVGAFIVNLMVSVTVAQRARELGLLRCIGASTSQLRRSVLLESLLTGAVNALAGLLLGFGVASALRALINTSTFSGQLPGHALTLTPRTVIAVLMVGCIATVLSGLGPARRASRVAPVAALLELPPAPGRRHRVRMVAGMLVFGAGLAALPIAVATGQGPLILAGAVLSLAGLRLLGPLLAGYLASAVGLPVAGALGMPGVLGRLNAVRNPERTAATASALAIGLALLAFITILSASTKAPLLRDYARDRADFQLWPAASQETGDQKRGPRGEPMNPALVARLRALPEVAAVTPVRCVPGTSADQRTVCAADAVAIAEVKDLETVSGSLADLGPGTLGVSQRDATAAGWTTGSAVTIHAAGGSRAFTVKAIYRTITTFGSYLMAPADLAQLGVGATTSTVYIRAAAADPAAARAAVARVAADYPGVEIHDRAEFHESDIKQINNASAIYRALTGLAALVGLFGIVGTLALSIVERRRELGLLRAVGMQRRQLRSMIRAEAVIVALVGAVLGIGLGILFGWAAARVFAHSSSPTEFTVPVGGLAAVAVLVALAGVAAAVLPARLASRVDVLRAIATE